MAGLRREGRLPETVIQGEKLSQPTKALAFQNSSEHSGNGLWRMCFDPVLQKALGLLQTPFLPEGGIRDW